MRKYLLLMAAGIFGILTANAYSVTKNDDGSVTIDGGDYVTSNVQDKYGDWHTVVSGAEGAGLNNSFTADEVALIASASEIKLTGFINNMLAFQDMRSSLANVTTVDMSGAYFEQNLNEDKTEEVTYYKYDPSSKTTSQVTKIYMKNVMQFYWFDGMTTAILPNNVLESICFKTFDENSELTTSFTIPTSVKYIATQAVVNTPITSVTIPENVEFINSQAFQNAAIAALISVTVDGFTAAASGAFDKMTTVGQTDSDYANYATLTFKAGSEHEGYFKNLNHPLSQAVSLNKGKFQDWLNKHYEMEGITDASQKNGWKEFINSGSNPPIPVPEGEKVVLRTFSDTHARIVPLDFRAYLVNGVTYDESKGGYVLSLVQIFAIPANTGVILYGEIDERATSFSMATIPSWEDKNSKDYVAPYTRFTGNATDAVGATVNITNYMVPAIANTKIYPYYKGMTDNEWKSIWNETAPTTMEPHYTRSGDVTDRNFIMTDLKYTTFANKVVSDTEGSVPTGKSCNYVGFFRTQKGLTIGGNKAYLSIPHDENLIDDPQSFEGIVLPQTEGQQAFRVADWSKFTSTGNWGPRSNFGVLKSKVAGDEIIEDATGIDNVNTENVEDNDYYTLQGVKVAHPQKGVYIKNGKKVILK